MTFGLAYAIPSILRVRFSSYEACDQILLCFTGNEMLAVVARELMLTEDV